MDNIALQVYTVRTLAQDDFPGTLRQVADIGYRAVELAGLYSLSTAEARRLLDDLGVRAISAHLSMDVLQTNPQQALADARELGCNRAALSWVGEDWRGSEEKAH